MNEWQLPGALGFSYEEVRSMSDERIIEAGHDSGDRLAAELANRLDLALERENERSLSEVILLSNALTDIERICRKTQHERIRRHNEIHPTDSGT